MTTLNIDLDGVMAKWFDVKMKVLMAKGYFLNLPPAKRMVEAARKLAVEGEVDVRICSSFLNSPFALGEKYEWVRVQTPEIKECIFVPYGANKHDFIEDIGPTDFLLDDYTKNLLAWEKAGGTGIKYLNGLNHSKGTWKGYTVKWDSPTLAEDIMEIINEHKNN